MKVLLIDNDDSFTYNLQHLLIVCGLKVDVARYRENPFSLMDGYDAVVISPGPGNPGWYPEYKLLFERDVPVLGICLGMQIINHQFGGRVERAPMCVHGKADRVFLIHKDRWIKAARYHSLYCSHIPGELEVIAVNGEGLPMGIVHKTRRIIAYQFHPESFLTDYGRELVYDVVRFWESGALR